ncbi:MAG: hypothetical protein IAG10_24600 [Planctomycetaceae bacterium]|nr:hypothetical protein [Planctomycetaceae bacterium]
MKSTRRATVLIGDIVLSRELPNRLSSQIHLKALMSSLNTKFKKSILSKFTITAGDEFEGVLNDFTSIPDLIWLIETTFVDAPIRLGFGLGSISTEVSKSPLEMDGQAFHMAREALDQAVKLGVLGGMFRGFGEDDDLIFNGFSRLLQYHWSRLTDRQRDILTHLRGGSSQLQIATQLGVSASAISQASRKSGWQAFSEAEEGFRAALRARTRRTTK